MKTRELIEQLLLCDLDSPAVVQITLGDQPDQLAHFDSIRAVRKTGERPQTIIEFDQPTIIHRALFL